MDISERIKKLREEYSITSNELATITGIHPVSIRKYESKKMVPGIDVIDKMCEALKLPRMIFEGFPPQYTDYHFAGDFYQLLFLLLSNGTIETPKDNENNSLSFTLNPLLSQYITIKNGEEIIPLENITIQPCIDKNRYYDTYFKLKLYLQYLDRIKKALSTKRWSVKDNQETRDEYISRIKKEAELTQLELMLLDHNWEQYMTGLGKPDQIKEALGKSISEGGNYYDFIMQADIPESIKQKYITAYEDAYISEIIDAQNEPYPRDGSDEEKDKYIKSILSQKEKFKLDHPDYKEQARQHALDNAQRARDMANKEN